MLALAPSESSVIFVLVFILSFLGILRKYVDPVIRMHNTSNENREMMIILLIIYFTKQNRENQEGYYGKLIFSLINVVNLMYVLHSPKGLLGTPY